MLVGRTLAVIIFMHLLTFQVAPQPGKALAKTQEGEEIYRIHCLRCHGRLGDGKGPDSPQLPVPPRDFHSPESTAKTDLELRSIIIWGLVFSPMHGWWDRLTPQEIREVVSYIRHLAPYQPRI